MTILLLEACEAAYPSLILDVERERREIDIAPEISGEMFQRGSTG
ncbi:hypothetical protein [Agromyces bauzanensis]